MFGFTIVFGFGVALVAMLTVFVNTESVAVANEKIIVDTDAGTDDAMALFLLLQAQKYINSDNNQRIPETVAITTVNGNTYLDNVCINVLKVLKMSDRLDIPVYIGAYGSLLDTPEIDNFYGIDGLGDVEYPLEPPDVSLLQKQHAANALVDWVNKYPGEIVILALGPMTNIAMAIRLDKNFLKKVKKLVILGGNSEGKGNVMPGVEFNFSMDPEANYVVINGENYENDTIHLLSLENGERVKIPMTWRKDVLGAINSSIVQFLNSAEHLETKNDDETWIFLDPIAAMYTLHPNISEKSDTFHAIAVTQGVTRGGLVVDYNNVKNETKKINLVQQINTERYKTFLLKYLS